MVNPLNAKLNPICHLLALLGAHPILHVSRIRVKCLWPISLWAVSRELLIVSGKFKARVDGLHSADRNDS
jgi:hypothetical protein